MKILRLPADVMRFRFEGWGSGTLISWYFMTLAGSLRMLMGSQDLPELSQEYW